MQPSRPAADRWVVAVWASILIVSCLVSSYIGLADEARRGRTIPFAAIFATEATSYIVIAALIPAVYRMQRRFPLTELRSWLATKAAAGLIVDHKIYAGLSMAGITF